MNSFQMSETTLDYVKEHCPSFQQGRSCPYGDIDALKGLAKGCPAFKHGCPFKKVKTVEEFKEMLGQMRDESGGKENIQKAIEVFKRYYQ